MAREMKDSGIEWIGEIPVEWKRVKLGFLYSFSSGDSLTSMDFVDDGKYDVYGANGIRGKYDKCNIHGEHLLIGRVGALCGNIHLVDDDIWVTEHALISYKLSEYIIDEFAAYLFEAMELGRYASGTAQPVIAAENIRKLYVPLPSIDEQKMIATFLSVFCSHIDSVIEQTRASIEEYKKLKQAVITQAVTKGIRPGRQMKDSGIEWIGDVPLDWSVSRVKNVSLLVTDGAHVSPETEEGIYDFVSTVNLCDDGIDFDNCLKTSENSYRYLVSTGCKPQIGDVLISKDGTVGKTVIVKHEREFVVASSLVIIRPNQSKVSSEFLNYALQSNVVQKTLELLMHGAGLKRVSVAKNANLVILVPNIEEQGKIVEYLNRKCKEIDHLIQKKESILLQLESYKKSLIYEYVTGKKEVTA